MQSASFHSWLCVTVGLCCAVVILSLRSLSLRSLSLLLSPSAHAAPLHTQKCVCERIGNYVI